MKLRIAKKIVRRDWKLGHGSPYTADQQWKAAHRVRRYLSGEVFSPACAHCPARPTCSKYKSCELDALCSMIVGGFVDHPASFGRPRVPGMRRLVKAARAVLR